MAQGNKLYPLDIAFYVRGEHPKALRHAINRLNALLLTNGLQPITAEADLLALDSYIRNLPMAYDPQMDSVTAPFPTGLFPSHRQPAAVLWPLPRYRPSGPGVL